MSHKKRRAASMAAIGALAFGFTTLAASGTVSSDDAFQFEDSYLLEPSSLPEPEAEINIDGAPFTGTYGPDNEVRGFVDAHTHMMSNVGFGGNIVCGKTFSEDGIADALRDCDYHYPDGRGALIENLTRGAGPLDPHEPEGWPTFEFWPSYDSLTHQQMYYRWVERAWRGGQRIMVNYMVNNSSLCELELQNNPNSCNDMEAVRLQIAETRALEAFIDDQYGGPGSGWYRIVETPEEARAVVAAGKLAVILGVEVSSPFDCNVVEGVAQCDEDDIDTGLDELYGLGIRTMYLCHKFDNALCGVRFDGGAQGQIVNAGNFRITGKFWEVEPCEGELTDNTISREPFAGLVKLFTSGQEPEPYPPAPHCNVNGISDLGEHALRGLIERGMILDIDHMSVKGAKRVYEILEEEGYGGLVSTHDWMDRTFTERLYALGGFLTPYGDPSEEYIPQMEEDKELRAKYNVGYGFGMDMNGFGGTPRPRGSSDVNPVVYPFEAADGYSMIDKQVTGERVFDVNVDGVAHYGMIPDYVEDLRKVGGNTVITELLRGAEGYLQTWGRAMDYDPDRNIALGKKAGASSTLNFFGYRLKPTYATDGNRHSLWWSRFFTRKANFRVDLGRLESISSVKLNWGPLAYGRTYTVDVSLNGTDWTNVAYISERRPTTKLIEFDRVPARYVRVRGIKPGNFLGYSIRELEVKTK